MINYKYLIWAILIKELHLRGIITDTKELITRLKATLITYKHLDPKYNVVTKKCFTLYLLIVIDWSRDILE